MIFSLQHALNLLQFMACGLVCYSCFCRLTVTERDTSPLIRHALAIKWGAFSVLGLSPWLWHIPASIPSVFACFAAGVSLVSTATIWCRLLPAMRCTRG